jgi:hypothetical protein
MAGCSEESCSFTAKREADIEEELSDSYEGPSSVGLVSQLLRFQAVRTRSEL